LLLFPPRHSNTFRRACGQEGPRGIGSECGIRSARTRHNTIKKESLTDRLRIHHLTVFGLASSRLGLAVFSFDGHRSVETNLRNRLFSNNLVWNCNSKVVRNSDSTPDCSKRVDFANSFRIYAMMGARGKNVRVPCYWLFWTPIPLVFRTQQGRHGGDCCSHANHWKFTQIVPLVEGELPLLLIYYRLSPLAGW